MDNRCDAKIDCFDDIDEDNCSMIQPNSQYKKLLVSLANINLSLLSINVTVDIENIGNVDVVDGVIEIVYKLTRSWYVSWLIYKNLKSDN